MHRRADARIQKGPANAAPEVAAEVAEVAAEVAAEKNAAKKIGASEGIRTLDIHLGKVTLYQTELRSLPAAAEKLRQH